MSQRFLVAVQQDRVKPRGKSARAVKTPQMFPRFQQRFLYQVFGEMGVATQGRRLGQKTPEVLPHQSGEGLGVAPLRRFEKGGAVMKFVSLQ